MGCYKRLIHDAFRRCNRNNEKSVSRNPSSSRSDPRRSQPIFRNSVLQNVLKKDQKKCPQFDAKRFDRNKVRYNRWYENQRILNTLIFVYVCGAGCVYYWYLETVPHTNRRHFVILTPYLEKEIGKLLFEFVKSEQYKGKFLPSHHPESIRVEKIGRDIIEGLRKGLNKLEDGEQTAHLEEFKLEFFVVDDPSMDIAMSLSGGKIIVFTGLLNNFKTDAEIATIIGHEVGHIVARHTAEKMSSFWLYLLLFSRWSHRRLIHDAFRLCNRNIEKSLSRNSFTLRSDPRRSLISQPIFRNSILQNVLKKDQKKCPRFDAKRFYDSDRNEVRYNRWYEKQRILNALIFVYICGASCVYYWYLETVPYTKRRHFVITTPYLEKKMGEVEFEFDLFESEWELVPSDHPVSIRVEKIGRDIIGGLSKGLNKLEDGEQTAHLEEVKWEFFIVHDCSKVNAMSYPGGKIVVFSGLLDHLKTDAEVAIVIGHEVGHIVARHEAEAVSSIWLFVLLFSWWAKRFEMEADYIGMLISASAGYDPRIAPEVYVKLEEHLLNVYGSTLKHTTHPHGKKRAELLSQPKVMEEALSIYTEALLEKERDKEKSEICELWVEEKIARS